MELPSLLEVVGSVQHKPHKMLRINIPQPRVSHFVDRPAILASILDRFSSHTSEKKVVLLGMGGSGKTQLALELCRQAKEDLGYMAVIWINASSPVSVMQSYKTVAKRISTSQQDDANGEEVISLVQDTLREWRHPWLCILDNHDNPKAFQPSSIHRYIPGGKEGRILFTSRHKDSARLGHKIEVSGMTKDESLKVLLQRSPQNDEESLHGGDIAATLGYHVLALDQAGSYLRSRRLKLCDFVSHYHKRKEVILKAIPDEWEYRRVISDEEKETSLNIFTTWELSFEQINGHEEEIRQKEHFLSLAAFFDITTISERYFEAYFKEKTPEWMAIFISEGEWDSDKLGDVLAEFQKLSLLQMPNVAFAGQAFSIHPVVRDWIQIRKSRETRQRLAQESMITLTSYLRSVDSRNLPFETNQETLLHIDSCVRHDKDLLSGLSDRGLDNSWIINFRFANFYGDQDRYDEAEKLYERALTIAEKKRGAADPRTLDIMNGLANTYYYQNRYDESEKLSRSIYNFFLINSEKTPNVHDHGALENLANVYVHQRRYDEAEKLLKRTLNNREKRLGATHPDTLTTVNNLANLYSTQGQYDQAERLYKRALTGRREKLGATHLDTLETMQNLGLVYYKYGRYDEAEKLVEEALVGEKEKLGATHSDTLYTIHGLGLVYYEQGRYDEAEKLGEQALTGRKERLGATHPETLETMYNLGSVFYQQSRYDKAEKLWKQALTGQEEKLGATHRETLNTMHGLGSVYHKQGRYNEAEKLWEQALIGRKEKLGATDPDTLEIAKSLVWLHQKQSRHDEAENLKQEFGLT